MRILRRRSNLEVSSKGFALFVAGLVLATFLGGAVRTVLSSERVHQRIVRELKSRFPRNEIEIGRIDVRLSNGIWPGFGLRVRDLVVRQNVCGKLSFGLSVPDAVLPINLWSLRRGKFRLGHLNIPDGRVDLDFTACERPGQTEESPSLRQTVQERGIRPPHLDWSDVAETLDGVDVSNFEVTFKRTPEWKLLVRDARVRFARELGLTAKLDVQRSLPFGTLSHVVNVVATGRAGEIEWLVTTELKEGRLRWSGNWNLAENAAVTKVQMVQVPLKELAGELFQMGVIDRELKFKSAWLSCAGEWQGPFARPFEVPIVVSGCHVEGGYGRAQLDHAEYFADRAVPFPKPAEIQLQRVQVQGLAEAAGQKLMPLVLNRAGAWSGRLFLSAKDDWTAIGRLEGVEISFSNQSVRGKQAITGVDVGARRRGDHVGAALENFALADGAVEGRADVNYALSARTGGVEVRFTKLEFSPVIQNILIGGRLGALSLTGAGWIEDGRVVQWSGLARASTGSGEGWRVDGAEARTEYRPGAFTVHARAARAVVEERWRYFAQLREMLVNPAADFAWRDVGAQIVVRDDGGTLSSLTAQGPGARNEWQARGTWRRDGELTGVLRAGASTRARSYRVVGEKGALNLTAD